MKKPSLDDLRIRDGRQRIVFLDYDGVVRSCYSDLVYGWATIDYLDWVERYVITLPNITSNHVKLKLSGVRVAWEAVLKEVKFANSLEEIRQVLQQRRNEEVKHRLRMK